MLIKILYLFILCLSINMNARICDLCVKNEDPTPEYFYNLNTCNNGCNNNNSNWCSCDLPPATNLPPKIDKSFGASPAKTIFIPRSIGDNTARQLVGWQDYIHLPMDCYNSLKDNYVTMAFTGGYNQSTRAQRISTYLFQGFNGACDNNNCARKEVKALPSIKTGYLDTQFYFGLNRFCDGLFGIITAPIAYAKWDLNLECNKAGKWLLKQQAGAKYGRIAKCGLDIVRLADAKFMLGYDFVQHEDAHLGFYGVVVAPTGNKPDPKYLFSPIVGNAKRWELGAGITGHMLLWEQGTNRSICIWLDGNIAHPFDVHQKRSFDFKHFGPLSRYNTLHVYQKVNGKLINTGKTVKGIDFCTRDSKVSLQVRGDISAKVATRYDGVELDIGYNFYGNTPEKVKLENCNSNLPKDSCLVLKENGKKEVVTTDSLYLKTGAASASATHKVFGHLNYNFDTYDYCNAISPFIGVGGEVEVEALACNNPSSLNQWGVWLKGGLMF